MEIEELFFRGFLTTQIHPSLLVRKTPDFFGEKEGDEDSKSDF